MTDRHAAACALFVDALRRGGRQDLVAGGRSMLPAVWPGDRLAIESAAAADLQAGDLAAWRNGAAIVVHRVVRTVDLPGGRHVVTRGDAMPAEDLPVPEAAVLGRVARIRRGPFDMPARGTVSRAWRFAAALLAWWFAARQAVALRWPSVRWRRHGAGWPEWRVIT